MAGEIWVSGPVIDILLKGAAPTAAQSLEALIDTGASIICVDKRVPLSLGLSSVNRKPMQMADGTEVVATSYMAKMEVAGLGFDDWVEVWGVPMRYPSSRVLLGRSFLKRYIVTYDGPHERFHYFDAANGAGYSYEELDG